MDRLPARSDDAAVQQNHELTRLTPTVGLPVKRWQSLAANRRGSGTTTSGGCRNHPFEGLRERGEMMCRIGFCSILLLGGVCATNAGAAPIGFDLLGGEWAIQGSAEAAKFDAGGNLHHYQDNYALNSDWSSSPSIDRQIEGYPGVRAFSRADAQLYAAVGSDARPNDGAGGAYASASTDAEWIFRPYQRTLLLEIDVLRPGTELYLPDPLSVQLEDTTAGAELYGFTGSAGSFWELYYDFSTPAESWSEYFPVDPEHEYRLSVSLKSTANFDGPWEGSVSAQVIPVPGALALGSIGISLLACLRRRIARS